MTPEEFAKVEAQLQARANALSADDVLAGQNLTTTLDELDWWSSHPKPSPEALAFARDVFRATINDRPHDSAFAEDRRVAIRATLMWISDLLVEIAKP